MSEELNCSGKDILWEEDILRGSNKKVLVGITDDELASFLIEENEDETPEKGKYKWYLSYTPWLYMADIDPYIISDIGYADSIEAAKESASKEYLDFRSKHPFKRHSPYGKYRKSKKENQDK